MRGSVWSFVFLPNSSSLAPDRHKINIINSDKLLQAIPMSRLGREIMHQRAFPRPSWPAGHSPQVANGQWPQATDKVTRFARPGEEATRMARGWFCSLLISSHLEHYGKQVGELESQRLQSELCTDKL